VAVEDVLEGRAAGAGSVCSLGRPGQLLRIPEEDDVAGGPPEGDQVGEGHLARLVDHQDVERGGQCGSGEQPRCAGHHVDPAGGDAGFDDVIVVDALDRLRSTAVLVVGLLNGPQRHAGGVGGGAHLVKETVSLGWQ
jgi:hypothetical protein